MAINPWLEEQLRKQKSPETLSLIVQCTPGRIEEIKDKLRDISGLSVVRQAFSYIEVTAPVEAIPIIEAIPGVVMVHYNMPRRIMFRRSMTDPLLGEVRIDNVIVPPRLIGLDLLLPFSPLRFLRSQGPLGQFKLIPTTVSRGVLRDTDSSLSGKGITLAVLDTGWSPNIQIVRGKGFSTCSSDPTPVDGHSHGSWCQSAAAGARGTGIFGLCEGIAPEANLISIKVLHGVFGFGNDMDIIKGMEMAWQQGARVVSMSLGGDACQGGCDNCTQCQTIKALSHEGMIFVIAAGNSGPEDWTIGCPGCSPDAITVGSHGITDDSVVWFSSRGPQNPENRDKMAITDETMKPDVLATGGGRKNETDTPDEVLYSGGYGVLSSMYTGVTEPGGYACMHGTSQATPHVAGLVACLLEGDLIKNAEDFKRVCAAKGQPKTPEQGWGIVKLSWFTEE